MKEESKNSKRESFPETAEPTVLRVKPIPAATLALPFPDELVKGLDLVAIYIKMSYTPFARATEGGTEGGNEALSRARCVFVRDTARILEVAIHGPDTKFPPRDHGDWREGRSWGGWEQDRLLALPEVDSSASAYDLLCAATSENNLSKARRIVMRYVVTCRPGHEKPMDDTRTTDRTDGELAKQVQENGEWFAELLGRSDEPRPRWFVDFYEVPLLPASRSGRVGVGRGVRTAKDSGAVGHIRCKFLANGEYVASMEGPPWRDDGPRNAKEQGVPPKNPNGNEDDGSEAESGRETAE